MSRQNHHSSRRLAVETLEGRSLLAGDVAVSVSGGDLVLTGDSQANEVQIVQKIENGAPVPGWYLVTGQNGTKINGRGAGNFRNINDDFRITLKGGADRLTLGDGISNLNFLIPDDLEINTGDGNDGVSIKSISVHGDATINTGNGQDTVVVKASVVGIAGGGSDLQIDTGDDIDLVSMNDVYVWNDLTLRAGTSNHADFFYLTGVTSGDNLQIDTGDGDDIVSMGIIDVADDLTVNTGSGKDHLIIDECVVDELFVNLGNGDDKLDLRNTTGRRAVLNGGSNVDLLTESNNNFTDDFQSSSF